MVRHRGRCADHGRGGGVDHLFLHSFLLHGRGADPAEFVGFLKRILPGKHIAELYSSIGFYKHGKSEFYRALIDHGQYR